MRHNRTVKNWKILAVFFRIPSSDPDLDNDNGTTFKHKNNFPNRPGRLLSNQGTCIKKIPTKRR